MGIGDIKNNTSNEVYTPNTPYTSPSQTQYKGHNISRIPTIVPLSIQDTLLETDPRASIKNYDIKLLTVAEARKEQVASPAQLTAASTSPLESTENSNDIESLVKTAVNNGNDSQHALDKLDHFFCCDDDISRQNARESREYIQKLIVTGDITQEQIINHPKVLLIATATIEGLDPEQNNIPDKISEIASNTNLLFEIKAHSPAMADEIIDNLDSPEHVRGSMAQDLSAVIKHYNKQKSITVFTGIYNIEEKNTYLFPTTNHRFCVDYDNRCGHHAETYKEMSPEQLDIFLNDSLMMPRFVKSQDLGNPSGHLNAVYTIDDNDDNVKTYRGFTLLFDKGRSDDYRLAWTSRGLNPKHTHAQVETDYQKEIKADINASLSV